MALACFVLMRRERTEMITLENNNLLLLVDEQTGAISSLVVKELDQDLVGEKRLAANFRICLPLKDYLCNYIEGTEQGPLSVSKTNNVVTVCVSGLSSQKGTYPIECSYTITLLEDEVRFRAHLTNHYDQPISEFWFPRLGGWSQFGNRDASLSAPSYTNTSVFSPFKSIGNRGLGVETPEWSQVYPRDIIMPWVDIHDQKSDRGLYLGYHDEICRLSAWHTYLYPDASGNEDAWLTPEQSPGDPIGLVFSHIRFPFIKSGETLDSGESIIGLHKGDWHHGSQCYRKWFMQHFPFDKSDSWLRKTSSWFSSIVYQPEDKIVADYKLYDQWCKDAHDYGGIDCHELVGWDTGGLERDYPDYSPEEKLGGKEGFRELLKSIDTRGAKSLVFVNYNILDQNTQWYKDELHKYTHQDQFGKTPNWMAWGQSTVMARMELSTRRHVLASVVPPLEKILEDLFLQLVKDGAHGFQIDKLSVNNHLDFNPLNTEKPDVAIIEGLVQAIARLLKKCRELNPEFCLASECAMDRMLPYIDVYYRNSEGFDISPLRYVFPEWTSCQHIWAPRDFKGVNGAVLTGSVMCVEPQEYQGSLSHPRYSDIAKYIAEVERIRKELRDVIFLGNYYDSLDAKITELPEHSGQLVFRVHGHSKTDQRAVVVVNASDSPGEYQWEFLHGKVDAANLYAPFEPVRKVSKGTSLEITGQGLHILLEVQKDQE